MTIPWAVANGRECYYCGNAAHRCTCEEHEEAELRTCSECNLSFGMTEAEIETEPGRKVCWECEKDLNKKREDAWKR